MQITSKKIWLRMVIPSAGILFWPGQPSRAADPAVDTLYEVTTELAMPHLEENLRYTITHEKHCLSAIQLHELFPILQHPALSGCRLGTLARQGSDVSYPLVCDGQHGTTGNAVWQNEARGEVGTLNVKLGGKNMTFYQRVTAVRLGNCHRPEALAAHQ